MSFVYRFYYNFSYYTYIYVQFGSKLQYNESNEDVKVNKIRSTYNEEGQTLMYSQSNERTQNGIWTDNSGQAQQQHHLQQPPQSNRGYNDLNPSTVNDMGMIGGAGDDKDAKRAKQAEYARALAQQQHHLQQPPPSNRGYNDLNPCTVNGMGMIGGAGDDKDAKRAKQAEYARALAAQTRNREVDETLAQYHGKDAPAARPPPSGTYICRYTYCIVLKCSSLLGASCHGNLRGRGHRSTGGTVRTRPGGAAARPRVRCGGMGRRL